MTVEAMELYCYITGTKPFCDQVDEMVGKAKTGSQYHFIQFKLASVVGQAVNKYNNDYEYRFKYMDQDAVIYKILSRLYPIA